MRKVYRKQTHLFIDRLEARRLLSAATVNFSTTYQTIDGFGAQPGIGDNPNPPDSAMQLAFSPTNGIGLEFIRGSLSANGYNQIVGMTQRAAAYGVQLVESPRGPAVSWLDNYGDATNGELDPAHYQDYANMVADYLQNSAAQGIPVYSVSMAVEPDLATTITPVWNGQQFAALLPYFANTFSARGITTKIMVNEDVGWTTADRNQILADPALSQYVSIVADHGYGQAFNPYQLFSNNMGKQVWMTEYIPQVSTDTQIQNAILTATDIHNAISVAGASAYLDCFLNFGTQGLMSSWTTPNTSLWAMGNFSKFVRPGWVRVGETDDGGLLLTTFKDPVSGKFAIVSINSGATDVSETYTLNGLTATSVTPYITSTTSNLSAGGAIAVTGGAFTATIPANSIITYYGQSSSAASLQAPVALYAGTVASAQTSQIALSWTDNSPSDSDYTIERSTNGNDWITLTTTWPAGTTTYVDTGLNEASTYYYRVQATSGANASPFSAVATGSTILAAPSNVTSTGISGGRNLTWAINSGVSTGVTIQRSTDGLIWSTIATINSRATSYSDTIAGYNSNEIYWYRVRNTHGSQTSAYGAYNTTVNTPTSFKATLASPTSVTLTWNNTAVGAYAAYINQNGTLITPPNLSANADTFTATGLTENTTYSFTVQALGPEAWFRPSAQITYGAWSAAANASITTPVAPPTGLTAVSTVAGTAVLNWVDNSAVETAYQVERSINGTSWTVLSSTLAAGTTTYPDNSAPTSGPVYYRVKALASTVSSAYIRTQMVSAVPTITTNATVTGTTTNLTATAPSGFGSGSLIYTWSIGGTPPASVGFSANGTTAAASTVATFAAAGAYVFRVTISDSSGNSTTATSTVTVNQTLSSITVTDTASPASFSGSAVPVPAIVKSTWQQLVATGLDQFGTKLTAQPTFTWSVLSGGGSVSSAGLYAAPTSAASPVVRASSGAISGQVALSVLNTAQLKADYSFNETSGWNLQDTLGVGITAKMSGGATLVPGHLGDAVNFDGISGSVWLGNPDSLDIRGQITMAAWIKPTSTSGTQMIVGRAVAHFPNQSATYLRISNGQYQVGFYDSNFRNAAFTIPAGDVGQWVYLVGTYDGKNWNLYRNGTLVSTFANSKGSTYVPESWRIGSTDQPDSYFSGSIDSVRLYAQALSATEVSALYNQTMVVTSSAAASPSTVTNATTNLSVAAVDPDSNSDADFTYTWSLGSGPAAVGFSVNGINAAKNTVATFSALGTYTLLATITDISGASVTSSVNVTVNTIVGTGGNDTIRLVRSNSTTLAVYINNPTAPVYSVAFSSLGAININPLGGNDTIILDFSGAGSPIPSAGLSINSSTGQDTLNLIGASGSNTANLSSSSLTFNGSTISYTNIASITLPQSTSFSTLSIQSGAQLTLGNSVMLLVGQLTLSGALDLNDGEMVLQNGGDTGLIQITSALESGFNASAEYWNGLSGIISSAAAGDSRHIMAVGALLNSAGFYGPSNTFDGYSAATTDVLVKYTYFGDSNLDGTVNATDYTATDNGFNNGSTGWSNGDFNYDGLINGDDYALIDNAFNTQSGAGPAIARPQALVTPPKVRPAIAPVQFVNAPAPAIAQANAAVIDQLDDLNIVPVLFTKPGVPDRQDTAIDNLLGLLALSEGTLADPDYI